jgi:hypothetical protein
MIGKCGLDGPVNVADIKALIRIRVVAHERLMHLLGFSVMLLRWRSLAKNNRS